MNKKEAVKASFCLREIIKFDITKCDIKENVGWGFYPNEMRKVGYVSRTEKKIGINYERN